MATARQRAEFTRAGLVAAEVHNMLRASGCPPREAADYLPPALREHRCVVIRDGAELAALCGVLKTDN